MNGSLTAEEMEAMIFKIVVLPKFSQAFYVWLVGSFGCVLLCAAAGNCLMLYAVLASWTDRRVLHHRCFYANLTACDLLVSLVVLPCTCADAVRLRWTLGQAACAAFHTMSVSLMCNSVLTLTAVSWLRSLSITRTKPHWLQRRQRVLLRELTAVAAIWTGSLLLAAPAGCAASVQQLAPNLTGVDRPVNWPRCLEAWSHESGRVWYGLAILCLACLLPLLSLAAAYFRICRAICASNRVLQAHKRCEASMLAAAMRRQDTASLIPVTSQHFSLASTCSAINTRKRVATTRRMFALSVALVGIFAATWLPMQVANLARALVWPNVKSTAFVSGLLWSFHLLAISNCASNPLLLMATHAVYRRKIRRLLCCIRCCGCRLNLRLRPRGLRIQFNRSNECVEMGRL